MQMAEQPLFHIILATADGDVHELDLRAFSADQAAQLAGEEVRLRADVPVVVTNIHARRVSGV